MIKTHNVIGSKETTFHDFTIESSGMDITISKGNYTQANVDRFKTDAGATVALPTPLADTHYELWLNDAGLNVLNRTDGQEFGAVSNPIDRLAWFTVPANVISLDDVEINVMVVNEG
jgi:hypothetical protein